MDKIRKWLHDKLKWGYPAYRIGGTKFQTLYACRFCNKDLTQDSQGNWFHLSDYK